MADDLNVGTGAAPEPQEQVSKPIDDSAKNLLVELGGKISSLEKELRGLQGRQDKSESAIRSQLAEYDKLIKKGMSHDEAVETLENKQNETSALTELQKQVADLAKHVKGNGNAQSASQEVVQAFADLGLDTKDPAVIIEMQKYKDVDGAVAGAYKFKKSMSEKPTPTSAQASSLTAVPKPVTRETLKAEYLKDIQAVRGSKAAVKAVQSKYKEKGLDVENIAFSV